MPPLTPLTDDQKRRLLQNVQGLLRALPTREVFARQDDPECVTYLGRAFAVVERWDTSSRMRCQQILEDLTVDNTVRVAGGYSSLKALLNQVEFDLSMDVGPLSVVVQPGQTFEYFDELRKIIETTRDDALFIDPYLDADFITQYMPSVAKGVTVRLLAGPRKVATLMPSVRAFAGQTGVRIETRVSSSLHDRYLFVDRSACYLSGASFKDGARNAPAVLTQITDGFSAMLDTYEKLWDGASPQT